MQVKAPREHLNLSPEHTSEVLQQGMDTDSDTFASMLGNLVRSGSKAAEAKAVGKLCSSALCTVFWNIVQCLYQHTA